MQIRYAIMRCSHAAVHGRPAATNYLTMCPVPGPAFTPNAQPTMHNQLASLGCNPAHIIHMLMNVLTGLCSKDPPIVIC